ncbi:VLRF1 family aeRF1-type release factor [Paenibacillus eucommiae]|uniref:Uncharacterized protein n=1 Tax=Paenibacillus eucommiae TaxID=1355755 RepID=A0ABS4J4Z1_9BACL|nr:VLRF1 family aeRF1-type release factor [Paenibacillus eucommiae]MBP1994911.1 hypothetical protein [Paenibacillus eucommiae]
MSVKQNLEQLKKREFSPEQHVLTIYLEIPAERGQQATWKIRCKNGMNHLIEYAQAEGADDQVKQLTKLQTLLEQTLEANRENLKNGLLIIACPTNGIMLLENLQIPLPNAFYWSARPQLDELEAALAQHPAAGIVLIGSESVTVLDTSHGQIKREWNYIWDSDQEDWKQYQGLSYGNREASGASHKDQFDKRYEANQQRWLKRLGPILLRHNQRNEWEEIVLSGEPGLTSEMAKELNGKKPLVLPKNLKGMPNHQVLKEVYASL